LEQNTEKNFQFSTTEKNFHVNNTIFPLPCTPIGAPNSKIFLHHWSPKLKIISPNFYKITPIGVPNPLTPHSPSPPRSSIL